MDSFTIGKNKITVAGSFIKIATGQEEWIGDIDDPEFVITALKAARPRPDIFTFCQRLPDTEPKYPYFMEWDYIAAIPVESYEKWLKEQINQGARKSVRKAEKKGVEARVAEFNDEFVKGITEIANETPIRQGRPYQHYGKNFDALKEEFAIDAEKCTFLGTYYQNELIGFIKLYNYENRYAIPFGMVSKMEHRDKCSQNALLAKAIKTCESRRIPYLLYGDWSRKGLGDFKINNGCQKLGVPRYFVPLTLKGKILMSLKLHRGFVRLIPENIILYLIDLRTKWYTRRHGHQEDSKVRNQ